MSLARALLDPQHIALVGAPSDPSKLGARAQRYLRRDGFRGTLSLVNPNATDIAGECAHASLADLPATPDLAFLLTGTERADAALPDCAARGVPLAAVLADGFAEAGAEGAARQQRLLDIARCGGVRLLGPNSMGVVNLAARTACCVNAALEAETLPAGRVALVSQSGSVMGAVLSRGAARGFGFSHLVGTGNEADLTSGEIAALLLEEPGVDVVLLFLEAIRDAPALAAASARAHALGKPIVVLKLGRSAEAAELAASHTGALAGADAAADAFFRAQGILRVTSLEALIEIATLAAFLLPDAPDSLRLLAPAGIVAFRTPESLADALAAFADWTPPAPPEVLAPTAMGLPDAPTEAEARRLFATFGLASDFAVLPRDDAPLPPELRFPLELKALSPDLAHRSEWGGVVLDIPDDAALRQEIAAMRARLAASRPAARIAGILVQAMQGGLAELILGFRRDPEVGPVVLLGAGGVHAEQLGDTVLRLAPVSEEEARAMIAQLPSAAPLAGHRGAPRGDLAALARAIAAFSRLAALSTLAEAEINPLLVRREGEGVAVLDAWIVPVRG